VNRDLLCSDRNGQLGGRRGARVERGNRPTDSSIFRSGQQHHRRLWHEAQAGQVLRFDQPLLHDHEPDDIVEVGVVIDTGDPRRVRRARIGEEDSDVTTSTVAPISR